MIAGLARRTGALLGVLLAVGPWVSPRAADATPSSADYAHGRAEVERLLADRPILRQVLVADDPLLVWVRARFAGAGFGQPIHWSDEAPPRGIEARHVHAPRLAIEVHRRHQSGPLAGQAKGAADHWADLIFELYNVAQRPAFEAAWNSVNEGRASLGRWLEEVARAEHRSLLYSRSFYRSRWRPWMRARGIDHLGLRWRQLLAVPTQFEDWIRRYGDGEGYPYRDYAHAWQDVHEQLRATGADWRIDPFDLPALPVRRERQR